MGDLLGTLPIFGQGFGPFHAQDNPHFYPLVLIAIGISIFFSLINSLRRRTVGAVIGQITLALVAIGGLYVVWLGFATPVDLLPGPPLLPGSAWPFLSPEMTAATYAVLGVLFHGVVLALLGGIIVFAVWSYQLEWLNKFGDVLVNVLTAVGLVIGFELGGWPIWWVVIAEVAIIWTVGDRLSILPLAGLRRMFRFLTDKSPVPGRRLLRFEIAIDNAVEGFLILLVVAAHPSGVALIDLAVLFIGLTFVDGLANYVLGIFSSNKGEATIISPRRWIVTVPFTLLLTVLGATGELTQLTGFASLDSSVWIAAGAAAAAYMLFKPLVDLARNYAGVKEKQPEDRDSRTELFTRLASAIVENLNASAAAQPALAGAQTAAGAGASIPNPVAAVASQLPATPAQGREKHLFERMNFRTATWLLFVAVCYHIVLNDLHIPLDQGGSSVPIVFGVVTVIAGVLNLLNNQILVATRNILLLLIFIIALAAAVTEILALLSADLPPSGQVTEKTLFAFLLFLTLGQLGYLYKLIDTTMQVEQDELRDTDPQGWSDFGSQLYGADKYAEAITAYDRVLKNDPTNAKALADKGYALHQLGREEDARAALEAATQYDQNNASAWFGLGYVLNQLGVSDRAEAAMDRALKLDATTATYWQGKGIVLASVGRHDEAVTAFQRAVELDQKQPSAYSSLGVSLLAVGRAGEAIAACNEALKLDAKYTEAVTTRAQALLYLGRRDEALRAIETSLAAEPTSHDLLTAEAVLLLVLHRWADALAVCQRTLGLYPADVASLVWQGQALRSLGRASEALVAFDAAIADAPEGGSGRADLGQGKGNLLMDLGQPAQALATFEQAITLGAKTGAWRGKAVALIALGRLEEGLAAAQVAATLGPRDVSVLLTQGEALISLGRFDQAISTAMAAGNLNPSSEEAIMQVGQAQYYASRLDQALATFDRMLVGNVRSQAGWSWKGTALFELSRYDDALAAFEKQRALAVDDVEAISALLDGGEVLQALARQDEATKRLQDVLAASDRLGADHLDNAQMWGLRGIALSLLGRYDEALAAFDASAATFAPDFRTLRRRAVVLDGLGRHDEALALLGTVLGVNPRFAEAWRDRARTLTALGRHDDAIVAWRRALELNEHNIQGWRGLAELLRSMGRADEAHEADERVRALEWLPSGVPAGAAVSA